MIGIFGGTFDPVHFGHLRAALECQELLGLDQLSLLPAGSPPHRQGTYADPQQRLNMLRLAVSGFASLQVDEREIRRHGASFMVDTLADLRHENGDEPLLLILGQDAVNQLDHWHEWRRLFDLAHLVIMRRPEAEDACGGALLSELSSRRTHRLAELQASPAGKVMPLEVTQLAISSTGIRRLIAAGRSPGFLLPRSVMAYIGEHQLYR